MQYRFEDTLTARDCKRHISHQVCIGATEATPGYLPGPLPPGEWLAEIDTHMIMPGAPVHYWLDVTVADGACAPYDGRPLLMTDRESCAARGAGWYRGDLHTHTCHSDADDGFGVAELAQTARDHGLDFVFVTDHNTTSGLGEIEALGSAEFLVAGGVELTTFWGHALCLGARTWVDWRVRPGAGQMARLAAAASASDQLFIIAHPLAMGDPLCTGCTWRFGELMPGSAQLVEIWNGPWDCDSNNEAALLLWYDWLNIGWRLVGTAGTDIHSARDYAANPGFNVVYAEALSEGALLEGIRAGHLYLSAGPQITFQAGDVADHRWIIGDTVNMPATFALKWAACPDDAEIRIIVNGRLLDHWPAGVTGAREWTMTPDQADWVLVEIRNAKGGLAAITNPIFLAP